MQVDERLSLLEFEKDLSVLAGMKVSRVWLGYADALFLDCGRLKKETGAVPKSGRRYTHVKGQVTFMLDCQWRIEDRYTVA